MSPACTLSSAGKHRFLIGAAVAVAIFSAVGGMAVGLATGSKTLGAATASVPPCDTNGLGVIQNLSGTNVVSVAISGLASACGGGTLSATVNSGSANSSGSATV